jgi:glycosyltransferase involved in cell wall biosynthesis
MKSSSSVILPIVAIDASRNRSGGAITHLLGILSSIDPRGYGIQQVHVWSYSDLLNKLPDYSWLVKHSPKELNQSLLHQVLWQRFKFRREISANGCNILLSTDAGTVARFTPSIVMSRDMLSFEGQEMLRYPFFSFSRVRLLLLKCMQIRSLQKATAALFLTQYAADTIQLHTNKLRTVRIIPHGISDNFRRNNFSSAWIPRKKAIKCTYVSNADLYKHQWHVVEAIAMLRSAGHDVFLNLVGAGTGPAVDKVLESMKRFDINNSFINLLPAQKHETIANYLFETDIFIFASSCENMPNTLIEAMAAGLPIACSNRGPMPEVLQRGGVYFNPEDPTSIFDAVAKIILNEPFRIEMAHIALERSKFFSWQRCAKETWLYLADVFSAYLRYSKI